VLGPVDVGTGVDVPRSIIFADGAPAWTDITLSNKAFPKEIDRVPIPQLPNNPGLAMQAAHYGLQKKFGPQGGCPARLSMKQRADAAMAANRGHPRYSTATISRQTMERLFGKR
jgi:hypothetical protein